MIDVEEILSKMNPNQKINYDRVMQRWSKFGKKMKKDQLFSCTSVVLPAVPTL